MSLRTLPVLFFSLGGEMLYILNQRLKAQNVPRSKSQQVVQDIVGQMFDPNCIKELFRPQRALTIKSLRVVFGRLAHASIMKLNNSAMDKLYDLMVMAMKYQVLMCRQGEEIIPITLNHFDGIKEYLGDSKSHVALMETAFKTLTDFYSNLPAAEYLLLKATLLTVFQDVQKRVSVFLKTGAQDNDGIFSISVGDHVPNGVEIPGSIKYFDDKGGIKEEEKFEIPFKYEQPCTPGSWALKGDRGTTLGTNMYDSGDTLMESPEPPTIKPDAATKSKSTKPDAATKSKSTKPDAATKSTKPDAATKSPKPDAATKSPKPDGATKFTKPEATKSDVVTKSDEKKSNTKSDDGTAGGVAKSDSGAELQLLEKLLVGIRVQTKTTFKLNLFGDDDDDNDDNISSKDKTAGIVKIDPSRKGSEVLSKIASDFTPGSEASSAPNKESDLLDLMDNTS